MYKATTSHTTLFKVPDELQLAIFRVVEVVYPTKYPSSGVLLLTKPLSLFK